MESACSTSKVDVRLAQSVFRSVKLTQDCVYFLWTVGMSLSLQANDVKMTFVILRLKSFRYRQGVLYYRSQDYGTESFMSGPRPV